MHVPYGEQEVPDAVAWDDLLAGPGEPGFEPVRFDHPLYVLFSSGTTGLPKAIVHGHGGQLIEHLKGVGLGWDLKPGGRLLWFSTTAWMMWNALVSALLVRASIVMIDGDPLWPDPSFQWRLAEETRASFMGVSPTFLMACRKAGLQLGRDFDLSSVRALAFAGSPLPSDGYHYVYEQLGPDILCLNGSGGTDICGAFVSGSFLQPVYDGEISGCCLGADVKAFDADANAVVGELGEMVITEPMPSMPVRLLERPRRRALSRRVLRPLPRRLAPGRLDPLHRARQLRHHRALRCDAQPRRRAHRHQRALRRGRGAAGGGRQPGRAPRGRRGRRRRADPLRRAGRRARARRRAARADRGRAALRALAAPRPRRDRRRAVGAAHDDRQEARGAGQAHPARRARRAGRQRATRSSTPRRSTRSWPTRRRAPDPRAARPRRARAAPPRCRRAPWSAARRGASTAPTLIWPM